MKNKKNGNKEKSLNELNNKDNNDFNFNSVYYNDKVYAVDNSNIIVSKEICRQNDSGSNLNLADLLKKNFTVIKENDKDYDSIDKNGLLYKKAENEKNKLLKQNNNQNNEIKSALGKDSNRTFNIYQDKTKIDSKIMKIVEKKSINTKPRNEYIPESMFLNLKRLREDYTNILEKYKDSIK